MLFYRTGCTYQNHHLVLPKNVLPLIDTRLNYSNQYASHEF
jgi:hypothetical protein